MKHLIILLLFSISFNISAQTIINKKGEVFDIRNVESGALLQYHSLFQCRLVKRWIEIDGMVVFDFNKWKKLTIKIEGKTIPPSKYMNTIMIKFFRYYGYKVIDTEEDTKMIYCGSYRNLRRKYFASFVKEN